MTKKRFTKCDTTIRDNGEEMTQAEVRDMLNAQHEEIQQSKELIKKYHNENTDLIKENEQLKSELYFWKKQAKQCPMRGCNE